MLQGLGGCTGREKSAWRASAQSGGMHAQRAQQAPARRRPGAPWACLCKPKVPQLGVALLVDEHILGLEVAVHWREGACEA